MLVFAGYCHGLLLVWKFIREDINIYKNDTGNLQLSYDQEAWLMYFLCVPLLAPADSGPSGEGCGPGTDAETRQSPHFTPGAAAAEDTGSAEWHATW
jgi:hypothetical protein